MQEAWEDWHRKSWSSWCWSLSPPCLSSPCWQARSPRPGGGPLQLSLPGSRVPDKVRCLWETFNYNDSLHLAISQITLPPSKSLYLSLALCAAHLVGGDDPICKHMYAAVFFSDARRKAWKKLRLFSKCFRLQNSQLLLGGSQFSRPFQNWGPAAV